MSSGGAKIPKFFIVKQVSEALDVSPRFGGAVRVAEVDLKAFLAQHRGDYPRQLLLQIVKRC